MSHNEQFHIQQAGFVATSGAQVSGVNVNQTLNESAKNLDLAVLSGELAELIKKLNENTQVDEDRARAISALTKAKTEADKGNRENVFMSLKGVGKWVLSRWPQISGRMLLSKR